MGLDFGKAEVPQEVQDSLNNQVAEIVKGAVEEQVGGLKTKNQELLDKLTKQGDTLKQFEGIDPVATKELLAKLEKDKDLQLLKDGKLDELVAKKVDGMKAKFEDQLKGVNDNLAKVTGERDSYRGKYESHVVGDAVTKLALEAKVVPSALADVVRRAKDVFVVTDKGELEARDKDGGLIKNAEGDLMTPQRFIEGLKKEAPHYWPSSKSGGITGDGSDTPATELENRMLKASADGDMETYRRLRREKLKQG